MICIQNNLLTRTLPIELGNLNNLGELDFSGNQLSGEIPVSLGACQSLQYLNASQNNLQGTIPQSVEQMKGLLLIDLSHNNLSGDIPEFLAHMRGLSTLNLSFNNFKGQVPEDGIFKKCIFYNNPRKLWLMWRYTSVEVATLLQPQYQEATFEAYNSNVHRQCMPT